MKDFIEFIVKKIVTNPDDVKVEENVEDTVVTITVCVNDDDMGLLIGKGGKTIRSIRALATAKAIKENVKVYVQTC